MSIKFEIKTELVDWMLWKMGIDETSQEEAIDACREFMTLMVTRNCVIEPPAQQPALVAALRRIAKEPDNVDEWLNADQMQAIARAALAEVGGER